MPNIGDYCLFRSREQGCVIGELAGGYGRTRLVKNARQLYAWRGNSLTLFDVALNGPKKSQCRLSETIKEIEMTEVCGIIFVEEKQAKEFRDFKSE